MNDMAEPKCEVCGKEEQIVTVDEPEVAPKFTYTAEPNKCPGCKRILCDKCAEWDATDDDCSPDYGVSYCSRCWN